MTDSTCMCIASHLHDKSPQRGDKLKKIFGSEAPRHYIDSLNAEAMPWYLRPNYDPDEILFEPNGDVKAGTASALVQRLTAHEYGGAPIYPSFHFIPFFSFAFGMTGTDIYKISLYSILLRAHPIIAWVD